MKDPHLAKRTNVQLYCTSCSYRAKRIIVDEPGCRGVHEAPSEPATCPNGHGVMMREDGGRVL